MNRFYSNDFNMVESNSNGSFVSISELNDMIKCGAISINRDKLEQYKVDTRTIYIKGGNTYEA